jgi:hypothetical protein
VVVGRINFLESVELMAVYFLKASTYHLSSDT